MADEIVSQSENPNSSELYRVLTSLVDKIKSGDLSPRVYLDHENIPVDNIQELFDTPLYKCIAEWEKLETE